MKAFSEARIRVLYKTKEIGETKLMTQQNIFVFWTEYSSDEIGTWLGEELLAGRLRQGWGAKGMSLADGNGDLLDLATWRKKYVAAHLEAGWKEVDRTERSVLSRYRILARMFEIRRGDLLVIPRKPKRDEIAIARATGDYEFRIAAGKNDFGHIVQVDKGSLKTTGYDSPLANELISGFSSYRSAINAVVNDHFAGLIQELYKRIGDPTSPLVDAGNGGGNSDEDNTIPGRIATTVQRLIRDTAKGRDLKKLYQYKCQVCGTSIPTPNKDVPYVEVHHIVALGQHANGNDDWNNMIVVCPNCHAAFDYGAYRINPTTLQVHMPSGKQKIDFHATHRLSQTNLQLQWERTSKP